METFGDKPRRCRNSGTTAVSAVDSGMTGVPPVASGITGVSVLSAVQPVVFRLGTGPLLVMPLVCGGTPGFQRKRNRYGVPRLSGSHKDEFFLMLERMMRSANTGLDVVRVLDSAKKMLMARK